MVASALCLPRLAEAFLAVEVKVLLGDSLSEVLRDVSADSGVAGALRVQHGDWSRLSAAAVFSCSV